MDVSTILTLRTRKHLMVVYSIKVSLFHQEEWRMQGKEDLLLCLLNLKEPGSLLST
jgi:hypothetical protein